MTTIRRLTDSGWELHTDVGAIVFDLGEFTPGDVVSSGVVAAVTTHQHSDHCDPRKLAALDVPVWAPGDTRTALESAGVRRVHTLAAGVLMKVTSVEVTGWPVDHGRVSAPIENFGVTVLTASGVRIWHAGDIAIDTLPRPLGEFDVVLVPIGDRYVMSPAVAHAYVASLGHRGIVVPLHYEYNPTAVGDWLRTARGIKPVVLACGETLDLDGVTRHDRA